MMGVIIRGVRYDVLEVLTDERGYFSEIFRASSFDASFVQSNHSRSRRGVLRGLHFHTHQSDLWYVVAGRAQVGLVDLRNRGDPTAMMLELSGDEPATLYIPPGVAHGFAALTDVDLIYWLTQEYDASDEHGIAWNDTMLRLPWAINDPILSRRDMDNRPLEWDRIPAFS